MFQLSGFYYTLLDAYKRSRVRVNSRKYSQLHHLQFC